MESPDNSGPRRTKKRSKQKAAAPTDRVVAVSCRVRIVVAQRYAERVRLAVKRYLASIPNIAADMDVEIKDVK